MSLCLLCSLYRYIRSYHQANGGFYSYFYAPPLTSPPPPTSFINYILAVKKNFPGCITVLAIFTTSWNTDTGLPLHIAAGKYNNFCWIKGTVKEVFCLDCLWWRDGWDSSWPHPAENLSPLLYLLPQLGPLPCTWHPTHLRHLLPQHQDLLGCQVSQLLYNLLPQLGPLPGPWHSSHLGYLLPQHQDLPGCQVSQLLYCTIYYHNFARFLVLGILPISISPSSTPRSTWLSG